MRKIDRWITTGECGNIATSELIAVLLDGQQHWIYRAWAALLLAPRSEKETMDALSTASKSDCVQWVRRDALQSLKTVSGSLEQEALAAAAQ